MSGWRIFWTPCFRSSVLGNDNSYASHRYRLAGSEPGVACLNWRLVNLWRNVFQSADNMDNITIAGWWRILGRVSLVTSALAIAIVLLALSGPVQHVVGPQIPLSDFLTELSAGHVRNVVLRGPTITGMLSDGRGFTTYTPTDANFMVPRLMEKSVRIIARPEDSDVNPLLHYFLACLPWVLWVLAFRYVGVRVRPSLDRATARRIIDLEARLRKLEVVSNKID
jgi:hypothetical protein